MTLRLAFMGTPEFAAASLQALVDAGHHVACAYSQPPRRAGRGGRTRMSPVQALAEDHGILMRTPESISVAAAQDEFIGLELDAAVVVAYGLRLPKRMLGAPKLGCVNAHASLLPRWRGAAPIERAILAGDKETGISIIQINEGLDTGPILLQERLTIAGSDDAGRVRNGLARLAARLIVRALAQIEAGDVTAEEQRESDATYAHKLEAGESRLDWLKTADKLAGVVRAFGPRPGAWFDHEGVRIKVLQANVTPDHGVPGTVIDDECTVACAAGALKLRRLQRPGKAAMDISEFLRGYALPEGAILS
jgi:methionyl-tRNA formyltransferase